MTVSTVAEVFLGKRPNRVGIKSISKNIDDGAYITNTKVHALNIVIISRNVGNFSIKLHFLNPYGFLVFF
jgi:hypothetical protein